MWAIVLLLDYYQLLVFLLQTLSLLLLLSHHHSTPWEYSYSFLIFIGIFLDYWFVNDSIKMEPSIYWLPWYFCLDWLSTLYYIRLLAIFSKVHNYVQGFYVMHFQLVFFFPFLNNNVKNGTTTSTQFRGSINQQGQTQTEEMIDIHICSNFRWTNNNDDEGCHKYPLKLDVDLQQIATKLEHHSMH